MDLNRLAELCLQLIISIFSKTVANELFGLLGLPPYGKFIPLIIDIDALTRLYGPGHPMVQGLGEAGVHFLL